MLLNVNSTLETNSITFGGIEVNQQPRRELVLFPLEFVFLRFTLLLIHKNKYITEHFTNWHIICVHIKFGTFSRPIFGKGKVHITVPEGLLDITCNGINKSKKYYLQYF